MCWNSEVICRLCEAKREQQDKPEVVCQWINTESFAIRLEVSNGTHHFG
jgi:hypothetical protein